jgi:hypothetical protein
MADESGYGNSILKAGDYQLSKFTMYSLVNGKKLDLSNLYRYIEIYEDIFSPYITAKLHIEDAFNFPERFPITGQEKIEIVFKSDINALKPVELVFRVYKLDAVEISYTGKTQQYILHLMSESGYFNFAEVCGYSVRGSVSEMVKTIFTKHFPQSVWKDRLIVEDTADNYSFVLPNAYSPLKAINWLSSKAFSKTGKDYSPFMFYETLDGHRFKSLDKIIEDGSKDITRYIYTPANMPPLPEDHDKDSVGFSTVLPTRYHKIQKLEELSRFDAAAHIMNGIVSSRLVVHDLLRKEQRVTEFFESDVFDTMKKLGTEPHFRAEDPEADRFYKKGAAYSYLPSTPYTVHNTANNIIDNNQVESLYTKRKYHLNTFLTQKIVIQIFGDSRRRVGDIVEIDVPKIQSDVTAQQEKKDKNLSGQYMVTNIKHSFAKAYSCKLELSRNCMGV